MRKVLHLHFKTLSPCKVFLTAADSSALVKQEQGWHRNSRSDSHSSTAAGGARAEKYATCITTCWQTRLGLMANADGIELQQVRLAILICAPNMASTAMLD